MKKNFLIFTLLLMPFWLMAEKFSLTSPDGKLTLNIKTGNPVLYSIQKEGVSILEEAPLALESNVFNGVTLLLSPQAITSQNTDAADLHWGTNASIKSKYNQLMLHFGDQLSLEFRVYNEGAAWRFHAHAKETLFIQNETLHFSLPEGSTIFFPEASGFSTPFEPVYEAMEPSAIKAKKLGMTPFMFTTSQGQVVVISESNLFQYPGMFIQSMGDNTFKAVFPAFPRRESTQFLGKLRLVKWPQLSKMMVRSTEKYISRSEGKRSFPWRVVMIAEQAAQIADNQLINLLADEPQQDFSWVKPGKVVWDWYHNWNFFNVDFTPDINTATYKYMIDFAADNGIEYVNIDDGWSKLWDFNRINSKLELEEVMAYAKEKNVGIFIWAMWQTLDKDLINNLDKFQKLGIAGLKVDFFDRCDQRVVDFVNTLAEECAKRHILLNLHGMYKPTGIQRTFPNVVNIEGVLGLEYNKFSNRCTPRHNLTIPFVRNVTGPMDYTPGGMRYQSPATFKKSWNNPAPMSTRAQQMAMYVVYHGGVQMLADSPDFYLQDSTALDFLAQVPVSWDESITLDGAIGEYIVVARRKGDTWYLAGMAADKEHKVKTELFFLDDKAYSLHLIANGEKPEQLITRIENTESQQIFEHLMPALGGFTAIIKPLDIE